MIHPDGPVCGVIVGNSYFAGNDKTMTSEYMGCPVGSRIVFQTKASPDGNVAGWHGQNITYSQNQFTIKNDSGTATTVIQNGIATDSNGKVWDTGSGSCISQCSLTTTADTKTATTDTSTATTQSGSRTTSSVLTQADTSTAVVLQLTSLSTIKKEDLLKVSLQSTKSTINVSVDLASINFIVTATKKGQKSITFKVTTDSEGDAVVKTNKNLNGYTVTLALGKTKLDSDLVRK